MSDDAYTGWYCAHCQRGVGDSEVTYHEQHGECGRYIKDDRPPSPPSSVPEGYALVPVEPTAEMINAAYEAPLGPWRGCVVDWVEGEGINTAGLETITDEGDEGFDHIMRTAYRAMVEAAQETT